MARNGPKRKVNENYRKRYSYETGWGRSAEGELQGLGCEDESFVDSDEADAIVAAIAEDVQGSVVRKGGLSGELLTQSMLMERQLKREEG